MATRTNYIEFANFVCKFGERDMLDAAQEVVLPAFLDRQMQRKYDTTTYFFHRVRLVTFKAGDYPVVAIAGRFVKDTVLTRSQYFDERADDLVQEEIELRNAPSAIFVLSLNDHRLIYLRETSDAPLLQTFATTSRIFIRNKHEDHIDETYRRQLDEFKRARDAGSSIPLKRPTKVALTENLPRPDVVAISLSGGDATSEYLDTFDVISSVSVKFITPNADEIDGEGFISMVFGEKSLLGAKDTNIYFGSDNGLTPEPAKKYITEALETENAEVKFKGTNKDGHQLEGDNEKVRLRVPYYEQTRGDLNIRGIAMKLYQKYKDARDRKALNEEAIPAVPETTLEKLRPITQNMSQLNQQSRDSGKQPTQS